MNRPKSSSSNPRGIHLFADGKPHVYPVGERCVELPEPALVAVALAALDVAVATIGLSRLLGDLEGSAWIVP